MTSKYSELYSVLSEAIKAFSLNNIDEGNESMMDFLTLLDPFLTELPGEKIVPFQELLNESLTFFEAKDYLNLANKLSNEFLPLLEKTLNEYPMNEPGNSLSVDLCEALDATIVAFKQENNSVGNEKLIELVDLLKAEAVRWPEDKILQLNPLLTESLQLQKESDYSGLISVLEKNIYPLVE
ncbi:MAG TPA: hypothetical protein EYQ77_06040 [Methylococcaceae bacterium]|jgi:hypothetical protein|nr:hypothetical protein [Methylococcaceae bacterium]HIL39255.1 hypothetical protein [Methylococcales bacterium]